jgi:hypothetical protein
MKRQFKRNGFIYNVVCADDIRRKVEIDTNNINSGIVKQHGWIEINSVKFYGWINLYDSKYYFTMALPTDKQDQPSYHNLMKYYFSSSLGKFCTRETGFNDVIW